MKLVFATPELNKNLVAEHGWLFKYIGYNYSSCMHKLYSIATGSVIWVDDNTYPYCFEETVDALQEPEGPEV